MSSLMEAIRTTVLLNDEEEALDLPGRLGYLRQGDKVRLHVTVPEGLKRCGFKVNQESNATPLQIQGDRFSRNVAVKYDQAGKRSYAGYPDNHLCLAELGVCGKVSIIKVGLLTQDGVTYTMAHETAWRPRLFRVGMESQAIVCPLFQSTWQTLHEVLQRGFIDYAMHLPVLPPNYTVPKEPELQPPPGTNSGVVLWYEPFRGVGGQGAIQTTKGSARVVWQEAPKRQGDLRYLLAGEQVTYQDLVAVTSDKTKFKYDARGVTLLS